MGDAMHDPLQPDQAISQEMDTPLGAVPIEITVSVGKARPLVRDLLKLERGAVLVLDRRVDDPVELYVGDRLIGVGTLEVVESDNGSELAVRLTELASLHRFA